MGDIGDLTMTSGLPSLLLPCPKCLVRMQYKATDASAPAASDTHEKHDTFGCAQCGAEVTRTHPGYENAA